MFCYDNSRSFASPLRQANTQNDIGHRGLFFFSFFIFFPFNVSCYSFFSFFFYWSLLPRHFCGDGWWNGCGACRGVYMASSTGRRCPRQHTHRHSAQVTHTYTRSTAAVNRNADDDSAFHFLAPSCPNAHADFFFASHFVPCRLCHRMHAHARKPEGFLSQAHFI